MTTSQSLRARLHKANNDLRAAATNAESLGGVIELLRAAEEYAKWEAMVPFERLIYVIAKILEIRDRVEALCDARNYVFKFTIFGRNNDSVRKYGRKVVNAGGHYGTCRGHDVWRSVRLPGTTIASLGDELAQYQIRHLHVQAPELYGRGYDCVKSVNMAWRHDKTKKTREIPKKPTECFAELQASLDAINPFKK